MKQPIYNTAIYCRLSRDDELQGESSSIATQRLMLRQYAEQNSLHIVGEYLDDGWSGTNFDRPDFQRMISDIEAGKINCVVTKDLSRLGRNYLKTGLYTEMFFPEHGVRYIAINDSVDSEKGDNDFAPFKNIMNEWYARDTSRKVKSALQAKFSAGAHLGAYAPLGYKKDPDRKGYLLIDDETRWIIEKIFQLAVQGAGAGRITKALIAEEIPTPSWFNFQRYNTFAHIHDGQPESKRHAWTIARVQSILKDETYIGNSVHNKQSTVSFKNKKVVRKPKDEWWKVEDTHEAIISKDIFEQVQDLIGSRRREQKDGTTQLFSGLIKCADCGWALRFTTNHTTKIPYSFYSCTQHASRGKGYCAAHYIRYDVLYPYVLSRLQYWSQEAQRLDQDSLLQRLLKSEGKERTSVKNRAAAELKRAEKRQGEIDTVFAKLYEDRASEKITERNFLMLSQKYQSEQAELSEKIQTLQEQLVKVQQENSDAGRWVSLIKEYTDITELTAPLLNALIEKIVVHEAVKTADSSREQEVEIFYRFIGKID